MKSLPPPLAPCSLLACSLARSSAHLLAQSARPLVRCLLVTHAGVVSRRRPVSIIERKRVKEYANEAFITGVIDNANRSRAIMKKIPLDTLLSATD